MQGEFDKALEAMLGMIKNKVKMERKQIYSAVDLVVSELKPYIMNTPGGELDRAGILERLDKIMTIIKGDE